MCISRPKCMILRREMHPSSALRFKRREGQGFILLGIALHELLLSLIHIYFVKYCGVTPAFALHTATLLHARLAGIDGETGSIEAGKAADLIVCAKDPRADLSALRTLSMVIKDGYRVEHPAPKKLPEVERELDKFL